MYYFYIVVQQLLQRDSSCFTSCPSLLIFLSLSNPLLLSFPRFSFLCASHLLLVRVSERRGEEAREGKWGSLCSPE